MGQGCQDSEATSIRDRGGELGGSDLACPRDDMDFVVVRKMGRGAENTALLPIAEGIGMVG